MHMIKPSTDTCGAMINSMPMVRPRSSAVFLGVSGEFISGLSICCHWFTYVKIPVVTLWLMDGNGVGGELAVVKKSVGGAKLCARIIN